MANTFTKLTTGGGTKLYQHNIYGYKEKSGWVTFSIINNNSDAMTRTELQQYFNTHLPVVDGGDVSKHIYSASGAVYISGASAVYIIVGIQQISGGVIRLLGIPVNNKGTDPIGGCGNIDSSFTFTDTVIALQP